MATGELLECGNASRFRTVCRAGKTEKKRKRGIGARGRQRVRLAAKRDLNDQLANLEREANSHVSSAEGRGKQRKGRNKWAIKYHAEWARRFHYLRTGESLPDPTDLPRPEIIVGEIR
jgi:hypothetical protein